MKTLIENGSTIAAISTPTGPGGIGIVKISGNKALDIVKSIFKRTGSPNINNQSIESHRLLLGNIFDPETGNIIDEVLLTYMKSPKSYTREDVVEINAHSGPVVLSAVFELVLNHGARIAEPGEFTKRAFLNGRIDLTQAEAVADIIQSRTEKSLEIAISHTKGYLGEKIKQIRNSLKEILLHMEASIDFPEDVEEEIQNGDYVEQIQQTVLFHIDEFIKIHKEGAVIREGLKICITGKPNVGKSSLLNCLLRKDRAIVTPIPGTTRDVVEDVIDIDGIPVSLSDTAGLHETEDPIETIGMNKAWDYIDNADMVLFLIDASVDVDKNDKNIFEKIHQENTILVINKSDLVDEAFFPDIPDQWKKLPRVKISALYDNGIDILKGLIKEVSIGKTDVSEGTIIPNIRQKIALEKSRDALTHAVEGLKRSLPIEMISLDVKAALDSLGEILGITVADDILNEIFGRFCIGK